MKQSIVRLPEFVDIEIGKWELQAVDHKIISGGLCLWMARMIKCDWWKEAVTAMQSAGISFEAVIEQSIEELESDPEMFVNMMYLYEFNGGCKTIPERKIYALSVKGRKIASGMIRDIRLCSEWRQLDLTLQQGMKQYLKKEEIT